MPNFRRTSQFDDGESPPLNTYPDWTHKDTEVWIRQLTEDYNYDDLNEEIGLRGFEVVEDMMGSELYAMKVGIAKVRVRKVK